MLTEQEIKSIETSDYWKNGECMDAFILHKFEDEFTPEFYNRIKHLSFLREKDERVLLLQEMSDYIGQVYNGGHCQYYDNGYTSDERSGHGSNTEGNIEIHKEMMELFQKYIPSSETKTLFLAIMDDFKDTINNEECQDCGGSGSYEDEDCYECNGSGQDEDGDNCSECGGRGTVDGSNCYSCNGSGVSDYLVCEGAGELDERLYAIDKDIEAIMNQFCHAIINNTTVVDSTPFRSGKKPKCKDFRSDGNAFALIGKVSRCLKENGLKDQVEAFQKEAMSGDYNNVLRTCLKYVDI